MKTNRNEQTRWSKAIIALAVLTVVMAASLFVTSASADARPTDYTQTDQSGDADLDPWTWFCLVNVDAKDFAACEAGHVEDDADLDPWTWFCLVNVDAKDFAACEAGHVEDDGRTSAQFATRDTKTPGDHAPTNWLCPAGTVATAFEMPIYDNDDLFVVGYETVWFCIDADNQPVG